MATFLESDSYLEWTPLFGTDVVTPEFSLGLAFRTTTATGLLLYEARDLAVSTFF